MEKKKNNTEQNKRLKKAFRVVPAVAAPFAVIDVAGWYCDVKTNKNDKESEENSVGYDKFNSIINHNVYRNNFVVLHIKNNLVGDFSSILNKISKCNEKGISVSIVLDTDAKNMHEIYSDIDFLQTMIKNSKIDLPVYCNIDNIVSNKRLDNSQKEQIISAFLNKMDSSNYYIGLYGSDSNLCKCNDYILKLDDYDCLLVQDEEEIKYNGTYKISKNLDGKITAKENLAKVIERCNLNNSSNMAYSSAYVIKEGETLESIALKYKLSEKDLKRYNHIIKADVGDTIYIPNSYSYVDKKINHVNYNKLEFTENYNLLTESGCIGIDIADYQENIDWNQVKNNCNFVIVEVARDFENSGRYLDNSNMNQIQNTLDVNLNLGLYFCVDRDDEIINQSQYIARLEEYFDRLDNDFANNNIAIDKSNVPVFLDLESYYSELNHLELMNAFERICKDHGYEKVGIYGNKYSLEPICQEIRKNEGYSDFVLNDRWIVWQSGGPQYKDEADYKGTGYSVSELEYVEPTESEYFVSSIRQLTNICTDIGASNSHGHCDVNQLFDEEIFKPRYDTDNLIATVGVDNNRHLNVPAGNVISAAANVGTALEAMFFVGLIISKVKNNIKKKRQKAKEMKLTK